MRFNLERVSQGTGEILTLAEIKAHCRIDGEDEDQYLTILRDAAVSYCEEVLRRKLLTESWKLYLDWFPVVIELPFPPVSAVTSIKYYDQLGEYLTLSPSVYSVNRLSIPARITLVSGNFWPSTEIFRDNAVEVAFSCGYGATSVPKPVKQAILFLIAHWYANRESVVLGAGLAAVQVPSTTDMLLQPFRDLRF